MQTERATPNATTHLNADFYDGVSSRAVHCSLIKLDYDETILQTDEFENLHEGQVLVVRMQHNRSQITSMVKVKWIKEINDGGTPAALMGVTVTVVRMKAPLSILDWVCLDAAKRNALL